MKFRSVIFRIMIGLAFAAPSPLLAQDGVVKEFSAGFGPNSVGVVDASEDTEIAGPQAIYAGDNGEIFLLDQVNSRVIGFDAKEPAERTRSLALPEGVDPTDLIVAKGNIYVWDGKPIALESREGGLTRSLAPDGAAIDETTQSMFAQMGSEETPEGGAGTRSVSPSAGRTRQLVASRGKGPVAVEVTPDKGGTSARIDVSQQGASTAFAKLQLKVRDKLGSIEFLEIDHSGRMYVLAENIPAYVAGGASTFIARFGPGGAFEGVYELPLTPNVALSRRFVTVSADGDVYFLRTRKGVVDVIGVGFRPMKNGQVIDVRGPQPDYAALAKSGKGAIAAVRPLTRESIVQTGRAFESFTWRLTPSSYGADPDNQCNGFNRIRRPGYLIGHAGQNVRGVPYCWGCQGSLYQFAGKVSRGALAGNVCTRNTPRYDVIGVDCSSFVSAAWGLSTHFTTAAIPSIASLVQNPWDLKPGDALNKPGSHVMLFMGFTPDRKAEVLEASPGGCNGRVCRNVYPLASLLERGYEPRRFRALAD
ncbi:hypothetical protein [Methylocella tundrae]|uniref:NlpC/P60 domain-containing protein n=1 Tax=Methylocella tundrae TaxID=227605 RepID=A0A4U8Z2T1_METTU|nr:hypothetical protein [Methylocella tundrae]WPP03503.1 hypothetical protein SIN04_13620 [Methylocella tundrae]VFU09602.1 conserved exported protein of unknown function [Methylocella tundrae]